MGLQDLKHELQALDDEDVRVATAAMFNKFRDNIDIDEQLEGLTAEYPALAHIGDTLSLLHIVNGRSQEEATRLSTSALVGFMVLKTCIDADELRSISDA